MTSSRHIFRIATVLLLAAAGANADSIQPLNLAADQSSIDLLLYSVPAQGVSCDLTVAETPRSVQTALPVPTPGAGALAVAGLVLAVRRRRPA